MNTQELRKRLEVLLIEHWELAGSNGEIEHVESFKESGVLTRDEGLVVRFDDGSEFQITIVGPA